MKNILLVFLIFLARQANATSWSAALPYIQKTEGQETRIEAVPYFPYGGPVTIGATKVFFRNRLLYTIDLYFRERILVSDDGRYLAVIHSFSLGPRVVAAETGKELINYGRVAVEIFADGKPFKEITLEDFVDKTKLPEDLFNWSYFPDLSAFDYAVENCGLCREEKREMRRCENGKDRSPDCLDCLNSCDSLKLLEVEEFVSRNSSYVKNNNLYVFTSQETVIKIDFKDLSFSLLPFETVVPDKHKFHPPLTHLKYSATEYPDKFDQPRLVDGQTLEQSISEFFDIPLAASQGTYKIFISSLIVDRDGKCVDYDGNVYDTRSSRYFDETSINQEMTDKLEAWIKQQQFETKLLPKKFDKYSFLCIVDLL